jgi:hypothetical protein
MANHVCVCSASTIVVTCVREPEGASAIKRPSTSFHKCLFMFVEEQPAAPRRMCPSPRSLWQPLCPACGAPAVLCSPTWRTRARPANLLSNGGGWSRRVNSTFARRSRWRRILARGDAERRRRQYLEGARSSWLAARAQHNSPALSAVEGALELSIHCDRSTSYEVAAEVRHVAQLSPELVEVNKLVCWRQRRTEACKQWVRGG